MTTLIWFRGSLAQMDDKQTQPPPPPIETYEQQPLDVYSLGAILHGGPSDVPEQLERDEPTTLESARQLAGELAGSLAMARDFVAKAQRAQESVHALIAEAQAHGYKSVELEIEHLEIGPDEYVYVDPESPVARYISQTWRCGCGVQLPARFVETLQRVATLTLERHALEYECPSVPLYCLECGKFVGWHPPPESEVTLTARRANRWHAQADEILGDHSSDNELAFIGHIVKRVLRVRALEALEREESQARSRAKRSRKRAAAHTSSSGRAGASKARATANRSKKPRRKVRAKAVRKRA